MLAAAGIFKQDGVWIPTKLTVTLDGSWLGPGETWIRLQSNLGDT